MSAPSSDAVHVASVDLRDVARRTGCTQRELLYGIRLATTSTSAAGAIVAPAEHATFLTEYSGSERGPHAAASEPSDGVDVALVSLAARPGVLDAELPKCLLPIGSLPLIGHVLSQLHAGGVSRFVIVLGVGGATIRAAVNTLPVARTARIEFIDLGPAYAQGFARSLLAASALLGGQEPFLLCTPDHIFDAAIVSELRTRVCRRAGVRAIALIEDNVRTVSGALPPTAVHVSLEELRPPGAWPEKRVAQISASPIPNAAGIEAGLYRCDGSFFATLAALSATRPYFTVAQAMQYLAAERRLGAMMTAGRRWLALETRDQMDATLRTTVDRDGQTHFPWQERMVRADSFSCHPVGSTAEPNSLRRLGRPISVVAGAPPTQRLVLPLATTDQPVVPTAAHHALDFLFVSADAEGAKPVPAAARAGTPASWFGLSEPLLPGTARMRSRGSARTSSSVDALTVMASVGSVGAELQAISIELLEEPHRSLCYLIDGVPRWPSTAIVKPMLALPMPAEPLRLLLPSAIDSVALHTSEEDAAVHLTVHKRVPFVGWLLLVGALVTSYSSAPATGLQSAALPPIGRTAFLRSAWRGTCTTLVCALVSCVQRASRRDLVTALRMRLKRDVSRRLLAAGAALCVNYGAFNVALDHTSISHAALFGSCGSIYIVLGQLLASALDRGPAVPSWHVVGVLLGGAGAFLATRDAASGTLAAVGMHHTTLKGDLAALVSGLGAATYLTLVESLRLDIDAIALYALVMGEFAALSLVTACFLDSEPPSFLAPLDPQIGVVGWLAPTPARLLAQLWLALVVDLAGNLGFIAVMAYVPALVVAAVMLLGPLTSCLEGIAVGVDQLPGPWTLGGALLITVGSTLIAFTSCEVTATVEIRRCS